MARRLVSPLPRFPQELIDQMRRANRRTRRTKREHGFYVYHTRRGALRLGRLHKGGPFSVSLERERGRIAFSYHCHVANGDLTPSTNDMLSAIRDNEPLFFIGTPDGRVREFRPLAGTRDYLDVLQNGLLEGEHATKASTAMRFTRASVTGLYVGRTFYRLLEAAKPRKLPRARRA